MKTEAFVLLAKGTPEKAFALREVEVPDLTAGQLRICVEGFGLNYADVMARLGLYREAPPVPCVLGYEVVGTIEAAGSQADEELIGKRVVGFCRFGGYAKHVVTEKHAIAEIGDMPTQEALALATQFVTAQYMVERAANVQSGERVLIHAAAGGVGTALVQLCKRKNAQVCAKVSTRSKEKVVRDLGADEVVLYKERPYEEAVAGWLGKERLDVSFNPVGGSTYKKDAALLGTGGRLILFGGSELSGGRMGIFSAVNFLRKMGLILPVGLMMKSRSVVGVNMLKIADFKPLVLAQCLREVVDLAKNREIHAVVGGVFSEKEFFEAHRMLENGTTIGKLTVLWDC